MVRELTKPRINATNMNNSGLDMSIVLVCWNNKDYLEPCLVSLYESNMRCTFDVVVVDNGSTDGSQEMLRTKYPDVLIVQNDHNVGLGRASNQGVEATNGRYILLLNNDTIVNGPSLDALVDFMNEHPKAGAVGGKLLNPDGSVQACYNYFSSLMEEFLISTRIGESFQDGYPAVTNDDIPQKVDWIGSACLLVRREAMVEVGLLDEEYFIYGDEADLQYKLKQRQWEVHYLPQATTVHYGGRSMDRWRRRRMVYRGKILFYKKNYGAFRMWILRIMLGVLSVLKLLIWTPIWLIPSRRERARKEIESNLEVIAVCIRLV